LALVAGKSVGWEYDIRTGRNYWFGDLQGLFGIGSDKLFGRNEDLYRHVHPEDRPVLAKALEEARENRQPYTAEFRMLKADGTVRWFAATGQFYFRPNGAAERMLGMAADITERKQAEEALADVSRKVIEAEERERKRISVDLHENIGQRLTMLTIEISQLKQESSNPKVDVEERLNAMWKQTLGILDDVKASAHELHSPRLEYLGLAAIVKGFCQEFSQRKGVEIEFKSNAVPDMVQPEIAICFFRVLQEALYNGLNHSGQRQFAVQIWGTETHLHLTVSDSGVGFDIAVARNGHGLGLIRMEERVKLLKGTLVIASQVGRGTKIYACVPLNAGSEAGNGRLPVNSATVRS
jgi:PAS domain S-box-containing protein